MANGSRSSGISDSEVSSGKLFIGGISWQTTESGLREYFEEFGELTDVALMRNKHTGQPRGFGFVKYKDPSAVKKVLAHTHTLDGRVVDVKRAVPRDKATPPSSSTMASPTRSNQSASVVSGTSTSEQSRKIFVGGLAPSVTDTEFRKHFARFGEIIDAVVMFDRQTQRSRGFGFITFVDKEAVEEVFRMQNHEINGKSVEVKRAEPKDSALLNSPSSSISGSAHSSPAAGVVRSNTQPPKPPKPTVPTPTYTSFTSSSPSFSSIVASSAKSDPVTQPTQAGGVIPSVARSSSTRVSADPPPKQNVRSASMPIGSPIGTQMTKLDPIGTSPSLNASRPSPLTGFVGDRRPSTEIPPFLLSDPAVDVSSNNHGFSHPLAGSAPPNLVEDTALPPSPSDTILPAQDIRFPSSFSFPATEASTAFDLFNATESQSNMDVFHFGLLSSSDSLPPPGLGSLPGLHSDES